MKKRSALILCALLAVLGFQAYSCNEKVKERRHAQAREDAHARRLDEALSKPPLSAQVPELPLDPIGRRAALQDALRPRADGRLQIALEELSGPAQARFADGHWVFSAAGKEIGRTGELPDFAQLFEMLLQPARERVAALSLSGSPAQPGRALRGEQDAIEGLRRAQAAWIGGEHSRQVLHEAAASAAALGFYLVDRMEVADGFTAHALALAALDAAAGNPAQGTETVIAAALGYRVAALSLARDLRGEDALRQYLAGDDARLEESAWLRDATPGDRFLRLRRLVELGDEAGVERWLDAARPDERFTTGVLAQLASQGKMSAFAPAAFSGPLFLAGKLRDLPVPAPTGSFEQAAPAAGRELVLALGLNKDSDPVALALGGISALDSSASGPLLRQGDLRAWFRASLVSALAAQERYFTDSQGNQQSTRRFAESLDRYGDPGIRELQAFAKARGGDRIASVFEALAAAEHLAGGATAALLQAAFQRSEYASPRLVEAILASARRFDSRIDHRVRWARVRYNLLADVAGARRLLESAQPAAAGPDVDAALFLAHLALDAGRFKAIAEDRSLPLAARRAAVDSYERLAAPRDAELLVRGYADEHRDRWASREPLVRFLRHRKRLPEARAEVFEWLRRWDQPSRGLEPVHARCAASRESWEMQRWQDGLDDIRPAIDSWAFCALRMGAYHLAKLERKEEADKLVQALLSRYPGVSATSEAAFVYWTEGDLQGAARVLANPSAPLTGSDVRFKVGPLFADAFEHRPDDALAAVNALHAGHVEPTFALDLGVALDQRGAYEGAFKVATAFQASDNGPRQMQLLRAASALRKWRGEAAAREWVAARLAAPVPARTAYNLALIAYRERMDSLIFSLPDVQGDPAVAESVWLFRAAALKRLGEKADPAARAAVEQHYGAASQGRAFELGRYLLGRLPESDLPRLVGDASSACEVPYYAGAKAEAEGRIDDASAWYLTAVSCLRLHEAEYVWAYDALNRLRDGRQPADD